MANDTLRIGTRGSPLALWQADHVSDLLRAAHPELRVERVIVKTMGDRILDQPLAEIGDKGLFTKELERALLDGQVDVAVHSMKDVPSDEVPGLVFAATTARGSVEDALVGPRAESIQAIPRGGLVGTGSLRRRCQLLHLRPDLRTVDVRGNVQTRLRKLEEQGWDAMILAAAGLERLDMVARIACRVAPTEMIPAVGQGALYVQTVADSPALTWLAAIHDAATALAVAAERRFMMRMEGGCQVPIGALATVSGATLSIEGFVGSLDGATLIRRQAVGESREPEAVGDRLAEAVLAAGGGELLASCRGNGGGR